MRPKPVWFSASFVFLLSCAFVAPSAAQTTRAATFACDGGPDAGGFSMVATYYFVPGAISPNGAAVILDGKTTYLTIRSHDDASGWTFYSVTPAISFGWIGSSAVVSARFPAAAVQAAASSFDDPVTRESRRGASHILNPRANA